MRATSEHRSVVTAGRSAPPAVAGFTITRVNPVEHADAIKRLFLDHERPEFPDYFDRAFPDAVAEGGTSWVGWDEHGRLCAHIAQFPRAFALGGRTLQGALLANLMVATAHRKFWPALRLVRRLVDDVKASGSVDLIYADPNELAQPVLRAAGFQPIGALQRFVIPLTDLRRGVAVAIRLYHLIRRSRTMPLAAIDGVPEDAASAIEPGQANGARSLQPVRRASLYRARLAGYPSASDRWYRFHTRDRDAALVGKALVRHHGRDGPAAVCVVQCEPMTLLSSLLVALARRVRDTGATRLEIWVMLQSQAANAVRRAGFLPRPERIPLLALPLTRFGKQATAAGCEWQLLPIDVDR